MKPRSEQLAYNTARKRLQAGTFVSLHACSMDVQQQLIWNNSDLVEAGINQALKEYRDG